MINNIRYIERMVSESFGDSFHDLEDTNYWELLATLNSKKDDFPSHVNTTGTHNAYKFLTHHAI